MTIDWAVKETVRTKLRVMVERTLRNFGYPPDKQERAAETVMQQAELLCADSRREAGQMPKVDEQLRAVLLPAFGPCANFGGPCSTMRWQPKCGHIPRGFCGATGKLSDVRLVLVCAEPGDPHPTEAHQHGTPEAAFESAYNHALHCLQAGTDLYHRNIRRILDLCFTGESFDEQIRKTWLTDSVLCSARKEGGSIPASAARACRSGYLEAQLQLFPNAVVAALGSKARGRMAGLPFIAATAAAPPGCNHAGALDSWRAIADQVRATRV